LVVHDRHGGVKNFAKSNNTKVFGVEEGWKSRGAQRGREGGDVRDDESGLAHERNKEPHLFNPTMAECARRCSSL
jgi:hypothetical protein